MTAESTLSLTYTTLRKRIGRMLGYGRDSDNWDTDQIEDISDCLISGLRQFYWPPAEHDWLFLKPTRTLALVADTADYDMPDDFGSLVGTSMTFDSETVSLYVNVTGEQNVRINQQNSALSSGRPQMVCISPKEITDSGASGQRFEAKFWPTPDAVYSLEYRCELLPYSLSSARIYPYGGAVHSETILQSCKAAAELHINREYGPERETFMAALQASIRKDKQLSPRHHGINHDPSMYNQYPDSTRGDYIATVNGVKPT